VAFSPDGSRVLTGTYDITACLWEANTGKKLARFPHKDWATAIAFSPDGRRVLTGSDDKTARVWEAETGRELARFVHEDRVRAVLFSPDGRHALTGSHDGTACVWEATDTAKELTRLPHTGPVEVAAFTPDGQRLLTPQPWTPSRKPWPIDDKYATHWYNLGNALHEQKKLPAAIDAFKKALAIDDKDQAGLWHGRVPGRLRRHPERDHPKAIGARSFLGDASQSGKRRPIRLAWK
jgi:predicted NACHT family NTPase